jgi:hypothetical protein
VPIDLRSFDKKARIYAHKKNSALPKDRDFFFKPEYPGAYAHLINADVYHIYVKNDTDLLIKIDRRNRLGKLVKVKEEYCQFLDEKSYGLAALNQFNSEIDYARPATSHNDDVSVSYGVKVYRDAQPDELDRIVTKFPDLFTETGRVIDVPEEMWMEVRLKDNWEVTGAKLSHKPYPLPANEQAIVNETLDKIHNQKKFEWTQNLTPYAFPVFVA